MKVEAIFGPPGTGKTRTLITRADSFKENSLFLSFTRSAAAEAVSRLTGQATRCQPSTIHGYAFRALNMSRAGVVDFKKLEVFSAQTGYPFKGLGEDSEDPQEGDEFLGVLSFSMNRMCPLEEAWDRFGRPGTWERFSAFCIEYRAWKKAYGYFDFDDMLVEFASPRFSTLAGYKVVFLDEAQDCSPLQWAVFEKIIKRAEHVIIAGDDDQAIYEWNGADPHGMIEFTNAYRGTHSVLGQSYRVPRKVHAKAGKLIQGVSRRVPKEFDAAKRMGSITHYGDVWNLNLPQLALDEGALILVRDRWRMDEMKRALNREMVPYDVIGGFSPWTSKVADRLRAGEQRVPIPPRWIEFYRQADLTAPVNVKVATIHQAKGREHSRVVVDLTLSARSLIEIAHDEDAERRVQYVGITRTSDKLILCGSNPLL